jgi:hypothetical protein
MKNMYRKATWPLLLFFWLACQDQVASKGSFADASSATSKGRYAYDLAFLKRYTSGLVELRGENGLSRVLLSADYQGRVMTSSAEGDSGQSFGWINYDLISSGKKKPHFNPVGGEERFWLGPEGGQFSLYFNPGDSFNLQHWQVPGLIDTALFEVSQMDSSQASFSKKASIVNYSGTQFEITITRKIRLLTKASIEEKLQYSIPPQVQFVGFESDNQLTNSGPKAWAKEGGLISIWLLGMMTPSDQTKVVIPFHPRPDAGNWITSNYFGAIPSNRLWVKDSVLYFRCDGKSRGKIGISARIAKPVAGSFDFSRNVLTLIFPEVHPSGLYVNSKWEMQQKPYSGDVINSYNDGPLADGSQLGPFYEVESSSQALALAPGHSQQYLQTTCHLQGDYLQLSALAKKILGVDLAEVKQW